LGTKKHNGDNSKWRNQSVGKDEIHWWVFKREQNLSTLAQDTQSLEKAAKKLKAEAIRLRHTIKTTSYEGLVTALRQIVNGHPAEIGMFHDFANRLYQKDDVVPGILFTYRVWGTTAQIMRLSVNESNQAIFSTDLQECLETSSGLMMRSIPTAYWARKEIFNGGEIEESEFESYLQSDVGRSEWLRFTTSRVLGLLEEYWTNVLQSVRNILLELELYKDSESLVTDERFWVGVIRSMMDSPFEHQLWDFRVTLPMWHASGSAKQDKVVDFCENVAAFANAHGGAIVIGISDTPPREVIGVTDGETRMKQLSDAINVNCKYDQEFVKMTMVSMQDGDQVLKSCLVVAIAQTKDVVGVLDFHKKYSYLIRRQTGLSREDAKTIQLSKFDVRRDNYNFVAELQKIVFGGFISFSYKG